MTLFIQITKRYYLSIILHTYMVVIIGSEDCISYLSFSTTHIPKRKELHSYSNIASQKLFDTYSHTYQICEKEYLCSHFRIKYWWEFGIEAFISVCKVHIFWEGHIFLRNLHLRFVLCSNGQIYSGDFAKFVAV